MKNFATVLWLLCSAAQAAAPSTPADQTKDTLPKPPANKHWSLIWNDEFEGTTLDDSKWSIPPEGKRKDGFWSPKPIALDGKGHLVMSVLQEDGKFLDGCVITKGKFEHTFGYYVARVQLQKQPGHWAAFWITGAVKDGRPGRDGTEIDIMEKPWLDNRVNHALHWGGYGKDHQRAEKVTKAAGVTAGWHTFGLWWKPDEYIFYVDGRETWRTNAGGVCQVPEHILLSDEIGTWAGDIRKAKLPDSFMVDYVRVYDLVEKE